MEAFILATVIIYFIGLLGTLVSFNRGEGSTIMIFSTLLTVAMIVWGIVVLVV